MGLEGQVWAHSPVFPTLPPAEQECEGAGGEDRLYSAHGGAVPWVLHVMLLISAGHLLCTFLCMLVWHTFFEVGYHPHFTDWERLKKNGNQWLKITGLLVNGMEEIAPRSV